MDLQSLLNKTFSETELYETLFFEIEENFKNYFSKFIHFYFDRFDKNKICLTEIVYFENDNALFKAQRALVDKKEWFEIYENYGHIDLMLCRLDRSGKFSIVYANRETHHQEMGRLCWADEFPTPGPLTPEEMRKGFQELAFVFEDQYKLQKLRSKKAV